MSQPAGSRAVLPAEHLDLLSVSAKLLFENGETTNGIVHAVNRLGAVWVSVPASCRAGAS